ncbi:MAG: hypothetical protein U0797_20500 [Gemmataceae bacterium]
MTKRLTIVLALALAAGPLGAADDSKAARGTLDRAIEAMGGRKLLAKKALSGTSRGSVELLGIKSTVTNEWTVQGLDQLKWVTDAKLSDGNTAAVVLVLNGDKTWAKANNGEPNPLEREQTRALQQGFGALRLIESLLPLTGKEWKLSSLGELKIDDVAAVGLKVAKKGLPELDLYFDKATHLPLRAEMRITEPGGLDVPYVAKFAAYKKVEGRQYFTKLTLLREDKVVLEMERGDFQAKDAVDEETFGKP